jgi:hypothetical protein
MSTVLPYEPREPLAPNVKPVLIAEVRALERSESWCGIEWRLELEGKAFGAIDRTGALSAKLQASLDGLYRSSRASETRAALEQRMRAIDAKYASCGE